MRSTSWGVQEQVVIFKKKAADVNLNCELHDYADEQFYQDGLAYKRAHPEKLVILICSSSKAPSTALNQQRFQRAAERVGYDDQYVKLV